MNFARILQSAIIILVILSGVLGTSSQTSETINSYQIHQQISNSSIISDQTKLQIVATTSIIADFVATIGGTSLDLKTLISDGVDPHEYQPSPTDTITLDSADFVFYSGGGLEEGLESTLDPLTTNGKAIALFDAIPEDMKLAGTHSHLQLDQTVYDPHFWHDPIIVKYVIQEIEQQLSSINPNNQLLFQQNAANFENELILLNSSITTLVNQIPAGQRILVTQHAAFSYWAHRFGFIQKSLEGISTEGQVGLKEIDDLANYIKSHQITVLFTEVSVSDKSIQALIEATEAIGWVVKVGGTLLAGSLGGNGEYTYIDMMEYNGNTIVNAILNPPDGVGSTELGLNTSIGPVFIALMALIVINRNWTALQKQQRRRK